MVMAYHHALPSIEMLVSGFITAQVSNKVSSGHFLEKLGQDAGFFFGNEAVWRDGGAGRPDSLSGEWEEDCPNGSSGSVRIGSGIALATGICVGQSRYHARARESGWPLHNLPGWSAHQCTANVAATVLVDANQRGGLAVVVIVVVPGSSGGGEVDARNWLGRPVPSWS